MGETEHDESARAADGTVRQGVNARQGGDADVPTALERKEGHAAEDLAKNFIESLTPSILEAARHAMHTLGDDVSARVWLDRRIKKPLAELVSELIEGKRPSVAPRAAVEPPGSEERASTPARSVSVPAISVSDPPRAVAGPTPAAPAPVSTGRPPVSSGRAPARSGSAPVPSTAQVSAALARTSSGPPRPNSARPTPARTASVRPNTPRPASVRPVASMNDPVAAIPSDTATPPMPSLDELSQVIDRKQREPEMAIPLVRPSSRPPAPPAFQSVAPKMVSLSDGARSTRPPPPPWRGEQAEPAPQSSPAKAKRKGKDSMPPPPSSRRREIETLIPPVKKSEEDLIEPLVKRLEALKFVEDRAEAARYVLELALDVVPARVGLIHAFDSRSSEFSVEAALGDRASALESWSTDAKDPLLSEALRQRQLVHITATKNNPSVSKGRFAIIRPLHAVVCAPVYRTGKRYGAIELIDPHERSEFARNQLNALAYLSGELARFLEARLSARPQANAS